MKKILLFLIPAIVLFSNCSKNDDYQFEMRYPADFTISSGLNPLGGTHVFQINNIRSNYDNYLSENTATGSSIDRINPGSARLLITSITADNQFSYVSEISVKIFSNDEPDFEKEIFYHDAIPFNQSGDLQLIPSLVDAKEFLEKDDFSIRVEFRLRDFSPETVDTRIDFSFFAK